MYRFLINPHSRSGKAKDIWENVKRKLEEKNVRFEYVMTSKAGEAVSLTAQIMEQFRNESADALENRLVILGGDGTLDEALNGMDFSVPFSLGYIPTGSGCDFARAMKMPVNAEEALDALLASNQVRCLDCGVVYNGDSERRFAVSCGAGYDAAVCFQSFEDSSKEVFNRLHLGKLSYLWMGLQQIIRLKTVNGRLRFCREAEGEWEEISLKDIGFVSMHVQPYEGGGFRFAPKADPGDGLLDICAVTDTSTARIVPVLAASIASKHLEKKGVHYIQCRKAELLLDSPLPSHADGELNGHPTILRAQCLPSCVPLLVR